MILVKYTNFVLVGSNEFEKNRGHWSWVGHDQVNARLCQWKKIRAAVGVKYVGLCR